MKADGWNPSKIGNKRTNWIRCNSADCTAKIKLTDTYTDDEQPEYIMDLHTPTVVIVYRDIQYPYCSKRCSIKGMLDLFGI